MQTNFNFCRRGRNIYDKINIKYTIIYKLCACWMKFSPSLLHSLSKYIICIYVLYYKYITYLQPRPYSPVICEKTRPLQTKNKSPTLIFYQSINRQLRDIENIKRPNNCIYWFSIFDTLGNNVKLNHHTNCHLFIKHIIYQNK